MPTRQLDAAFTFEGFSTQRYTQIPNVYFDHLMQDLSPSENLVLMYIFRRTFGFGKDADAISLTQMAEGITTRDGRVLDRGTGMSRPGCRKGIQGLLDKGIISVQKAIAEDGNNEVNIYRVRFKDGEAPPGWGVVNDVNQGGKRRFSPGVVNDVDQGSKHDVPGVVNIVNPHEQRPQKRVKQQQPPQAARVANRVVVASSTSLHKDDPSRGGEADLLAEIVALGVTKAVATQLLKDHTAEEIREQLAVLPHRPAKEPAAVFVKALKERWAAPKAYTETTKKAARAKAEDAAALAQAAAAALEAERSRQVDEYLAELTDLERGKLESAARTELEETGQGSFWRGRDLPAAILNAQVRLIVRQRLGLDDTAQ